MKLLRLLLVAALINPMAQASLDDVRSYIEANHVTDSVNFNLSSDIKEILSLDLKGKKVVFLGESDHYFHEKFTYRLAFIKELLKKGYYNIYAELGVADGIRVNRYLETGNEDYLKQVGLYGFKYGQPLKYRDNNYVKEIVNYFRKLRELKLEYPKLKYAGFDLDMYPGTAYLDFDEFAKREDVKKFMQDHQGLKNAIGLLDKAKKATKTLFMRLNVNVGYPQALELRDEAIKTIKDYDQFLFYYKVFRDSLTFKAEMEKEPINYFEAFDWREKRMFEIMSYSFANEDSDAKYIFLGHNGHLSKTNSPNSKGERYIAWDVIGAWITAKFPKSTYGIWSFIGQGEHSGHGCPNRKRCALELVPGTLEEILFGINSTDAIFFKNSDVIRQNEDLIKTLINGKDVSSAKYGSTADAFYFLPQVQDLQNLD